MVEQKTVSSHTEMCKKGVVTSGEEGHDVESVIVRSDVVKETMSAMVKLGVGQPTAECLPRVSSTRTRLFTRRPALTREGVCLVLIAQS